jgi:2'-5' RNA ligase
MSEQTHRTSLCIIPPNYLWQPIQDIREQHDPAYPRWMPHINIIYPFIHVEHFDDFRQKIHDAFRKHNIQPVNIKLNATNLSHFDRKANESLMILLPNAETSAELNRIYDVIMSIMTPSKDENASNDCHNNKQQSKRPFTPHMTLGSFERQNIAQTIHEFQQKWSQCNVGLPWTADSVFMIARDSDDTPFRVIHEIPFK